MRSTHALLRTRSAVLQGRKQKLVSEDTALQTERHPSRTCKSLGASRTRAETGVRLAEIDGLRAGSEVRAK